MPVNLDNDSVFEVSRMLYNEFRDEQNQKRLDQDNLHQFKRDFIKPLYPHDTYIEDGQKKIRKFQCGQFCCDLTPGNFCCCKTSAPDEVYKNFGLGACLYFKFVKHLMIFLIFVSVLSVFSVLLYYMVAINSDYNILENYESFIFGGTAGSLSARKSKCQYSVVTSSSASFQLQCDRGTIAYKGATLSNQTKNSLANCRAQIDKLNKVNEDYALYQISYTESLTCNSQQTQCNVSISSINSTAYPYVSYAYSCSGSQYPLGSITFTDQIVLYVTVSIDLFIILFFLIFLGSQNEAEKDEEGYFKKNQLSLHDFSIQVDGFNSVNFENQFDFFTKGMDQKVEMMDGFTENIVQVKVPDTELTRQAIQHRRSCYQKLYDLIEFCFFDEMNDLNDYESTQDFIKRCYGSEEDENYIEYKRKLNKYVNKYLESKELKYNEDSGVPISCYIVMSNPRYKKAIFQSAQSKCFTKYLNIQQREYKVSQPPVADMILWENKYKWTTIRVIFIWIITLGICFASYLLVGVAQYQKQVLNQNNNFNSDCSVLYTGTQLTNYDSSLQNAQGYIHCYCFYNYFTLFNLSTEVVSNCSSWHSEYLWYLAIPILISLGIVLYNLIISRFFKLMTKFEAHSELTTQLYSYIIKRTFVLVMNMGLLMILLKLDYNGKWNDQNVHFLFLGTYNDITTDWYVEIGTIITLTLAINILIPIFEMMFLGLLRWLRKIWDRRCGCRKTSQKTKKGYIELYSGDVFPIEERYADLLSIMIITLAFSGVIPGLYIIAFFSILFMFVCDKCLVFRVYQNPVNYTSKLQSKIFKTVYFALMIHCLASAFLLSQENLIVGTQNVVKIVNTGINRFDSIFQTNYLIPYVVLFLLLFVWAFFSATLISLIKYCYARCKQHEMSKIHADKLSTNFYHSLNDYQTLRLKLSMERDVNKKFHHSVGKKDNFLKAHENTEMYFMKGTQKIHQRQIISRTTLMALGKRQSQGKNAPTSQTKLIGKAGYQEIFDDDVFYRERKIRVLDQNFKDLLKRILNERSQTVDLADINITM